MSDFSSFDLYIKNDLVDIMKIELSNIEKYIAINLPLIDNEHLSDMQKIMIFQDRKLDACKIMEIEEED